MLKDITLGQYFPGDTVAHRLDPRTKLLLVIIYSRAFQRKRLGKLCGCYPDNGA